ncbi:MAG: hypothetical protein HFJ60_03945 [Clostridia bacterium]|jgi:putative membrane protein|nr:hypothetical protein [Clostridia bacterium]
MYKVFIGANNSTRDGGCIPNKNGVSQISSKNYTNVLKTVHENIDSYVGKKICFTGYVYRVLDLEGNQFVLARDMIINSNYQSVIVGFLCQYDNAKDFANDTWVQVTGEILKGDYHGDMPILNVIEIDVVPKPSSDEYVYPPDDSYIPTNGIL